MPKPSVSARPDYRAARTRARRRSRRRRRQLRQGLLALVCCLLLARGAAFAAENALDALFLDEPAQQLPADTPASVSDRSEPPRLEPEGGLPAQTDAREALEDYLAQLPGRVSVLAVRPSDGLTVAWNEDEQYYAASLLKAPYALWLCRRTENGELDLEQPLGGWDGTAREALTAMIARSDNQATAALYTRWPADGESGFAAFLEELDIPPVHKARALSSETKITGTLSARDAMQVLKAMDDYFATGTPLAETLKQAFLNTQHEFLITDWPMAKKYGNWTGALHDIAIVYAPDPYYAAVLTDWGDPVKEAPEYRDYYREISARLTAFMES
ncbi:hypothetical protein B5E65_14770 [Gemmiger sp. An120]|uniref:serine hydrolase n=1 Tax=Gemmiger sp. An120 TaxID=1965549 RepID=UPI000B38F3E7|nr:serine hydrolase [Gemmiger sp. An120]OUQ40328.1 hypothetical protein B5E65_14770 [Gemmiger sp. An120]